MNAPTFGKFLEFFKFFPLLTVSFSAVWNRFRRLVFGGYPLDIQNELVPADEPEGGADFRGKSVGENLPLSNLLSYTA